MSYYCPITEFVGDCLQFLRKSSAEDNSVLHREITECAYRILGKPNSEDFRYLERLLKLGVRLDCWQEDEANTLVGLIGRQLTPDLSECN